MTPSLPSLPRPRNVEQSRRNQTLNPRSRILAQFGIILHLFFSQVQTNDVSNLNWKPILRKSPQIPEVERRANNDAKQVRIRGASYGAKTLVGKPPFLQRRRLKKRRGLLSKEPRSIWRLGSARVRYKAFMSNGRKRRAIAKQRRTRSSWHTSHVEENWEKAYPSLWNGQKGQQISRSPRTGGTKMEDSIGTSMPPSRFNESLSSSPIIDGVGHSTTSLAHASEEGDVLIADNVEPNNNPRKRKSSRRAECWNHFTIAVKDGVEWGTCNYCDTRYESKSVAGTSNFNNHLTKCPAYLKLRPCESSTSKKIDLKVFHALIADAIMRHGLSFTFVEYEFVRKIFKYLNANVDTITRNTIKKVCLKRYENLKGKVKDVLKMVPGRISLTCDTWTACTGKGFLCLTAHYIDETWKLHSKLLCFLHLPPPHTGYELSVVIGKILFDWDIQRKIFSLTADNASNMDAMVKKLKEGTVLKDLVCKGKYFHIRCCAHILNLIVQNGLKVIDKSILKLREGIKYIAGSEARFQKFYDIAKTSSEVSFSGGLWLDVATRWNSTYIMLDRALKYRVAMDQYFEAMGSDSLKYQLRDDEWKRIDEICQLLKPFYEITTLFSGSDYPTANLYLPQVFLICQKLKDPIVVLDSPRPDELEEAIDLMIEKFDKYWNDYVLVLALAVVFDPRYKFMFVEYSFYGTYGDVEGERKAKEVKLSLEELFQEYQAKAGIDTSASTERLVVQTSSRYDGMEGFQNFGRRGSPKSELDKYLEEERMDMIENYDVLEYWKTHSVQYPVLSAMARDILAIPITSVASESTFSMGGRIISKCRSALTDKNADALVTMQNWLTGYDDFSLEGALVMEQIEDRV